MKVAILIGFSYGADCNYPSAQRDDPERTPLPGIVIDLYQAYTASVKMGADKICIITDINRDQQTSLLMNAMIESIVYIDILSFIDTIKKNKFYSKYQDRNNFIKCILENSTQADEVFIYYTGHVSLGHIIFPIEEVGVTFAESSTIDHVSMSPDYNSNSDEPKMSLTDFRLLILDSVHDDANVLFVMDCCNSNGLNLPFKLCDKVYRLSHNVDHTDSSGNTERTVFVTQKVICISSTMSDENSITSRDGSIFTRAFFKQLKEEDGLSCRSISRILTIVGEECTLKYAQTATVHSSYPNLKMLWNWVYQPISLNINVDYIDNVLIITPKID